ncbi:MAG: CoA transferase [Myxococcales bacterium]|nr:CoA transferase [Myxococcales bacterium]
MDWKPVPRRGTLGGVQREASSADFAWARSGAMALSGRPEGAPRLAPAPLAAFAEREASRLRTLAPHVEIDGGALLGERAALAGLTRRGRTAPGGACQLLRARDGWLAVNLARSDDSTLIPAWLETDHPGALETELARRSADTLISRARLLGLAVAPADPRRTVDAHPPHRFRLRGPARARADRGGPRVVDLSALWAGPLCGQLLGLAGGQITKVECRTRPDGARFGNREFYDLLNGEKASVGLDFRDDGDRQRLLRLLRQADIVIESARPRALRQLGIDAEACVRENGNLWVSITGYGRGAPEEDWIAFGDDAAAAAGLCAAAGDEVGPLFCGDAIADPLAGLHAAVAALEAWSTGTAGLIDVSLCGIVAHILAERAACGRSRVDPVGDPNLERWQVRSGDSTQPVRLPRARRASQRARPLGADTATVLEAAQLSAAC